MSYTARQAPRDLSFSNVIQYHSLDLSSQKVQIVLGDVIESVVKICRYSFHISRAADETTMFKTDN